MYKGAFRSPVGWMNIEVTDWSLIALYFTTHPYESQTDHPLLNAVGQRLKNYFEGNLTEFDLPLDPPGTVFQRHVWEELQKIPAGKTIAYRQFASHPGISATVRVVAAATASNPIALFIPCHRVISARGANSGDSVALQRKQWLLQHEQHFNQLSLF